jgi:CBS domain containing-hemolysin-like protein
LPTGGYATVGGLLNAQLGRLADAGDAIVVSGWRISVLSTEGLATHSVRIERAA